jgi:predicted HAD superfamily Cof-like phosphohydrolase
VNKMQEQVAEFHRKFAQPIAELPTMINERAELRAELIREEARETAEAIESGDLVGTVDGICDLIYVALGAALEAGVDVQPFFDEVHRTNMAKVGGPTRADGKVLKPAGWVPPNIAGMLAELTKK